MEKRRYYSAIDWMTALSATFIMLFVSRESLHFLSEQAAISRRSPRWLHAALALAIALLFGLSRVIWSQSVIAETHSLTCFYALVLLAHLLYWLNTESARGPYVAAFLLGLSLAISPLLVLFIPVVLITAAFVSVRICARLGAAFARRPRTGPGRTFPACPWPQSHRDPVDRLRDTQRWAPDRHPLTDRHADGAYDQGRLHPVACPARDVDRIRNRHPDRWHGGGADPARSTRVRGSRGIGSATTGRVVLDTEPVGNTRQATRHMDMRNSTSWRPCSAVWEAGPALSRESSRAGGARHP